MAIQIFTLVFDDEKNLIFWTGNVPIQLAFSLTHQALLIEERRQAVIEQDEKTKVTKRKGKVEEEEKSAST